MIVCAQPSFEFYSKQTTVGVSKCHKASYVDPYYKEKIIIHVLLNGTLIATTFEDEKEKGKEMRKNEKVHILPAFRKKIKRFFLHEKMRCFKNDHALKSLSKLIDNSVKKIQKIKSLFFKMSARRNKV